jgi:G:T/U-mismatch repair DNA glycosylase/8-oxo-dGTP pyrophosphatase MutT (NUDIX family)
VARLAGAATVGAVREAVPDPLRRAPLTAASAVPDVLAPGLRVVFCGINPGRASAAAGAHFANPRNDFWRLLHEAGFTPRLFAPEEQFRLLELGIGLTNAASRTTRGSGDLRRADFDRERLERVAGELTPRAVAFVGKEAYRGLFGERPELGPQQRTLGDIGLFVLPSTSPANAAVPYSERLRWFEALRDWLEPVDRPAVRALVLDARERVLLVKFVDVVGQVWWATPGGGIDEDETLEQAIRRELREEAGLTDFELGPEVWTREHTFAWAGRILRQREHILFVRVGEHEPSPTIDLRAEGVHELRWWTVPQLEAAEETLVPERLPEFLRELLAHGPPAEPVDVGI